jgi:hypothetical protein
MSVEAERRLRKAARGSGAEAFLVRMNARVATHLAGPGGGKLLELERETGKYFTVEPVERMPLTEVDVIREGTRADVDGGPLPVADGDELRLKISEPHMYNTTDGVARMNGGYGIVVAGAIGYVGQEHRIRVERASRTGAFATLLDAKPTAFDLEPEPEYAYELPEMEREVGERLELEERTRPRRTRQTPAKSRTTKAKDEPAAEDGAEAEEAPAKKPAPRRRTRKKAEPDAAAAEAVPEQAEAADEPADAGDGAEEAATAAKRRRRGKRGGRGRSKAGAAAATGGGDADAAAEVVAAEPAPEPSDDGAAKPKPRRRRTPAKARPAEPAAEEPAPAPAPVQAPVAEAPAAPAAAPTDGDGKKSGGLLGRLLGS